MRRGLWTEEGEELRKKLKKDEAAKGGGKCGRMKRQGNKEEAEESVGGG